jgi:hypothetical protein
MSELQMIAEDSENESVAAHAEGVRAWNEGDDVDSDDGHNSAIDTARRADEKVDRKKGSGGSTVSAFRRASNAIFGSFRGARSNQSVDVPGPGEVATNEGLHNIESAGSENGEVEP